MRSSQRELRRGIVDAQKAAAAELTKKRAASEAEREAKIRQILAQPSKTKAKAIWGTQKYLIEEKASKLLDHPRYPEVLPDVG